MIATVREIINTLNNLPKDLVMEASISIHSVLNKISIEDVKIQQEPVYNVWIHPVFTELAYTFDAAETITMEIINGMKVCKNNGKTRGLPSGIIKYCTSFNNVLIKYYHDYNKADKIISEIIDNNVSLWR